MENDEIQENQEPILAEITEKGLATVRQSLTAEENKALEKFLANQNQGGSITRALSADLQEQLFQLYVNGTSITEIARINPNLSLGQIVHAAVEYKWKETKDAYVEAAIQRNRERLPQMLAESVEYISDMVAATHKLNGKKIKLYLQTGDEDYLQGIGLGNFKAYKELIDAVAKLSSVGSNGGGKGPAPTQLTINNNVSPDTTSTAVDAGGDLLASLAKGRKK